VKRAFPKKQRSHGKDAKSSLTPGPRKDFFRRVKAKSMRRRAME